MRFDWYQGTVPERDVQEVCKVVGSAFDYLNAWRPGRAQNGYERAAELATGSIVKARIMWGGVNADHGVHVLASGDDAPVLARCVRERWPDHKVSRFDSCEDYDEPGAYERLREIALRVATKHDVKANEIVSHRGDDGCTLYIGSPTSAVRGRIYEKGKQLGGSPHWARAELQVRPSSKVKGVCSRLPPSEVWGLSSWSQDLAVRMGNADLRRVAMASWRPTDFERAYTSMLRQYGNTLRTLLDDLGSWECVGKQIGDDLTALEQQKGGDA